MNRNRISLPATLMLALVVLSSCVYAIANYTTRSTATSAQRVTASPSVLPTRRATGGGAGGSGGGTSVSSPGPSTHPPAVGRVDLKDGYFPSELTIPVHGMVTWVNSGLVCSLAGRSDPLLPGTIPQIQTGGTWTLTFDEPGTYNYGCQETRSSDTPAQIIVDPSETAVASGTSTLTPASGGTPTDTATATATS